MRYKIKHLDVNNKVFPAIYRSTCDDDPSFYFIDKKKDGRSGANIYQVFSFEQQTILNTSLLDEELMRDYERLPMGTEVILIQE